VGAGELSPVIDERNPLFYGSLRKHKPQDHSNKIAVAKQDFYLTNVACLLASRHFSFLVDALLSHQTANQPRCEHRGYAFTNKRRVPACRTRIDTSTYTTPKQKPNSSWF
jgi:hypothetical protein